MPIISSRQFGLIVAFLIPGFIGLAGLTPLIPIVADWLRPVNLGNFGIGPTVYALMAATGVGMVLSCIRWLAIDHLLAWSGIPASDWDFRKLHDHLETLNYLSDNHYRYYQFYANTFGCHFVDVFRQSSSSNVNTVGSQYGHWRSNSLHRPISGFP
jgi:hypothetical protein